MTKIKEKKSNIKILKRPWKEPKQNIYIYKPFKTYEKRCVIDQTKRRLAAEKKTSLSCNIINARVTKNKLSGFLTRLAVNKRTRRPIRRQGGVEITRAGNGWVIIKKEVIIMIIKSL